MTLEQHQRYAKMLRSLKSAKLQERRKIAADREQEIKDRIDKTSRWKEPGNHMAERRIERLLIDWASKRALCDKEIVRRFMETTFVEKKHL